MTAYIQIDGMRAKFQLHKRTLIEVGLNWNISLIELKREN